MDLCSPSNAFHAGLAVALADLLREEGSEAADERAKWLYEASIQTGAALSLDALDWLAKQRTTGSERST
jgi:fatty acid-binding protein DegV